MAQITITTTPAQDARIAPAFGDILGLGRDATPAEVKGWIIVRLRAEVFHYEERTLAPLDPT